MVVTVPIHLHCHRSELRKLDDIHPCKHPYDRIHRVYLMPALAKIDRRWTLVVVIVVTLTEHEEVDEQEVHARVAQAEIDVTVFVRKPVDHRTVKSSHCVHNR